jgi:zinc transporter ZupT
MALSYSVEVSIIAVAGVVLIFLESIIFGLIPFKVRAFHSSQLIIDLTTSFAAGLYLALSLAYLLPEAIDIINKTFGPHDYPWDYFLVVWAFVGLLFLEKVILNNPNSFLYKKEMESFEPEEIQDQPAIPNPETSPEQPPVEGQPTANEEHQEGGEGPNSAEPEPRSEARSQSTPEKSELTLFKESIHKKKNYAWLLFSGVAFKSLLVGIAIGVQTKLIRVIHLVIAVVLYKWAEALAISITLKKTNTALNKALWIVLAFSLMPLGGYLLGIMITGLKESSIGIMYALVAGVLFYVASIDILQESFEKKEHVKTKFVCVCLGILFVIIIDIIDLKD